MRYVRPFGFLATISLALGGMALDSCAEIPHIFQTTSVNASTAHADAQPRYLPDFTAQANSASAWPVAQVSAPANHKPLNQWDNTPVLLPPSQINQAQPLFNPGAQISRLPPPMNHHNQHAAANFVHCSHAEPALDPRESEPQSSSAELPVDSTEQPQHFEQPTNSFVVLNTQEEVGGVDEVIEETPAEIGVPDAPDGFESSCCDSQGLCNCYESNGCQQKGCDKSYCRNTNWEFGTELTFLAPDLNTADVDYVVEDLTTPATYSFDPGSLNSLAAAPRLWVGVQGECWGVRGRYWHMADWENHHSPFQLPQVGDATGYQSQNQLDAYTIDLELTRIICHHDSKFTFAIGARYAYMEHDKAELAFARVDDNILTGSAHSNRNAYGTGLTMAMSGRKPLFNHACMHLFWNARTSFLWGRSSNEAETVAEILNPAGNASSFNGAQATDDNELFIGEVQLGVEANYQLKWLPASAFFRVAAEYQYWDTSMGDAFSTSFAEEAGVVGGTATADSDGLRMHLIGLALGAGFTW